jgi:tetratricopeptide (TPR) repeat protein
MGWLTHQVTIEICGGKEEVVFVKLVSAKVAYYLDAIKRAPDDPTNYFELARVYALSGNVDEAFDMLHKALLACGSPDSPGSPFGKGFGEVLATVRDLEPNLRSERWNNLASLLVKAGGAEQSPHKLADTIHTFFLELGRWQEIVELATSCLAKAQPSPLYHVWRLHAAGKIGDQDQFRRDFEAIIKKPIDAGGYGIAPLLRPVLVELGKWEEVAQVADFCVRRAPANDPYHQADTFSLWELEAFVKLKDWQRVSRAFDALVQQGILSRLTAPCPSEGPMFCAYQQTVLWMGAWAKMELAESQGLEALLQQYETDKERHYWVSLIRGEIWLRKPENHPPKPYLYALPCDQSPQIDGRLKDAVWARAGRSSEFYDYNSANRSSNQTTLLALYDAQCVYLGVECTVPEGERGADGAAGTAIEVFLDADRDYTTYTQIMLSPRGTPAGNACVKEPFCGKFDISPYWSPDYRVAAAPEETSWCFELAIPYRSLEATAPKPGQAWSFSVVRNGTHEYPAAATFVPVYRAYHEPHRFALLVFRSSTDSNAIKGPIQ